MSNILDMNGRQVVLFESAHGKDLPKELVDNSIEFARLWFDK